MDSVRWDLLNIFTLNIQQKLIKLNVPYCKQFYALNHSISITVTNFDIKGCILVPTMLPYPDTLYLAVFHRYSHHVCERSIINFYKMIWSEHHSFSMSCNTISCQSPWLVPVLHNSEEFRCFLCKILIIIISACSCHRICCQNPSLVPILHNSNVSLLPAQD